MDALNSCDQKAIDGEMKLEWMNEFGLTLPILEDRCEVKYVCSMGNENKCNSLRTRLVNKIV